MKFGPPLILTSTISLPAAGTNALFETVKLQAPNREAIAVSEVRFYSGYVVSGGSRQEPMNPAREIRISINVNGWRICESVPLWTLCPVRDLSLENPGGMLGCYRLKLRKPMFVPPGTGFTASARLVAETAGTVYPGEIVPLSMTVVARTVVSDFPRMANVPFLSSYCPVGKLTGIFGSLDGDLKNDVDQDVRLHHIVGRLGRGSLVGGALQVFDMADLQVYAPMHLSYKGQDIAPEGSDFNIVFDMSQRVLPVNGAVLERGQRLLFSMAAPGGVSQEPVTVWMPTIGLLGDRQEVSS